MALFGRSGELSYDDLLNRITELERRVAVLERAAHGSSVSPAPPTRPQPSAGPGVSPEVLRLAAAGQKIQAIKRLREETGLGLKQAKDIVDRL
ncbi:ribosomal protein L7/L12 [Mycolicibacterium sp. CBMA 226]|uniref:ribosomal protein L7/L12 n=1 Tax=Mycolicibacterium sp. CBMA 226 TaxID=2606611 RepID=UPI0012DDC2F5|nr:ribosomal protein L7/L12 [Mycolicibacterium sp. CBMA 226]MUL79817.1 50S ribosomal protein L12 [Mycolicibacterium sp. CBMA 226]